MAAMCGMLNEGRISEDIGEQNSSRKRDGPWTRSAFTVKPVQEAQRKKTPQRVTNPHNASSVLTDGDVSSLKARFFTIV
jgi:hypothetical protein